MLESLEPELSGSHSTDFIGMQDQALGCQGPKGESLILIQTEPSPLIHIHPMPYLEHQVKSRNLPQSQLTAEKRFPTEISYSERGLSLTLPILLHWW